MGITERKERERAEMRRLILDEATRMFLEEGYEKTSLRKIANRIEYSAATIYLYYKSKNELFYAIHERGFELFFNKLSGSLEIAEPLTRLEKMGRLYIEFALESPEYYDLIFIMRAPMESIRRPDDWSWGMRSFGLLRDTVAACMEAGVIDMPGTAEQTALTIWSFIHGMVSLSVRQRLPMFPPDDHQELMNASLAQIMNMLKAENA